MPRWHAIAVAGRQLKVLRAEFHREIRVAVQKLIAALPGFRQKPPPSRLDPRLVALAGELIDLRLELGYFNVRWTKTSDKRRRH